MMKIEMFKQNFHGYVLYKILKSIIDPEDSQEYQFQNAINQYFFRRKIYSSKDIEGPGTTEKHKYDQFVDIMKQPAKLFDMVEAITHRFN